MKRRPTRSTLFPYTTLFRSAQLSERRFDLVLPQPSVNQYAARYKLPTGYSVSELPKNVTEDSKLGRLRTDRKSTRLNSSHTVISYAVFCLKKKKLNNLLY